MWVFRDRHFLVIISVPFYALLLLVNILSRSVSEFAGFTTRLDLEF
jgi:hypothetical protein